MAARRFEFQEGGSSKFWEIEQDGSSVTVRYGRIGAAGTAKTTAFSGDAEAAKEVDKLVREKTKKGYQEVGGAVNWRPPVHIPTGSHVEKLRSRTVTRFVPDAEPGDEDDSGRKALPALKELDRRAFFVGVSYDDDGDFNERLQALLADPKVGELKSLLIGAWDAEYSEDSPDEAWALLAGSGAKLASLEDLFLGEITQEESEISWIHIGDPGKVIAGIPSLKHAYVRGHGDELRLTGLKHAGLTHLTVQTGGLSQDVINDLIAAELPELTELVLWLGTDEYGNNIDTATLGALLARFPKLEHLGLQDAHNQDEVIEVALKSPVIGQLKGLDFSMGTATDAGAKAILASPAIAGLKTLSLRHHYIGDEALLKALRALPVEVDLSDKQKPDGDYVYPEVTE